MATLEELQKQLVISRNEIKNLRQQLINLTHQHKNDVENIKKLLVAGVQSQPQTSSPPKETTVEEEGLKFKPIGVIRTIFPEKRAVPRQSSLANDILSYLEIDSTCFNNPEHSLEGLHEFSHLWLIYHFHKNSSHQKAKVAPPRLNGERVGVFSSRSPHRPCPIGLSLVQIDKIELNRVYFYGSDMVDETPVLDIKPYIPQYDCPSGFDIPEIAMSNSTSHLCPREAPDGQETSLDSVQPSASSSNGGTVRVPNWINAGPTLNVLFNDRAAAQVEELNISKKTIADLLEVDPRSIYLRTKHGSQIFTFQLGEATVTCKFDDKNSTVTVVQVRKTVVNESP